MALYDRIISFLEVQEDESQFHSIWRLFFVFSILQNFFIMLSNTFMILYVINNLELPLATVVLGMAFVTQGIFDFPSGIFSDYIGQKRILIVAYIFYIFSFIMLIGAQNITEFILAYIVFGFASSQESGALRSWFDRVYSKNNSPGRDNYFSVGIAKVEMARGISGAISMIIGGGVSYYYSRQFVFYVQIGMAMVIILCIAKYLSSNGNTSNSLNGQLSQTFRFIISDKKVYGFILGSIMLNSAYIIWTELFSRQIYYGYTGSDLGAGVFRFFSWITITLIVGYGGKIASNLSVKENLWKIHVIHPMIFFGISAILLYLVPFQQDFNSLMVIIFLTIFFLTGCLRIISYVLQQTYLLREVPNEIRNSIYSLSPSLVFLVGFVMVNTIGYVVDTIGYSFAIVILLCMEIAGSILFRVSLE